MTHPHTTEPYNFDKIINRRGTHALKTDALLTRFGKTNLIPLWVADMDFATPPFITEALKKRINHPIFGYTQESPGYRPAITQWLKRLHNWNVDPEWLTYIPGIVKGIGLAINTLTNPKDNIIIQPPVYYPFQTVPQNNQRTVIHNPLKLTPDGYQMDFPQLEHTLTQGAKALILSNPHNPSGTVWTRDTLATLADLCAKHHTLVISDEIHADMTLFQHRHTPFATASNTAAQNSITFAAPSKTFNIPGIISSFAIVPNETIRTRFYTWLKANELNTPNLFAAIATEAAYTKGWKWRKALIEYLEKNAQFTTQYITEHLPNIHVIPPQASFLIWLDCRDLHLSHHDLIDLFVNRAGIALNDGETFGPGGSGFMRLNIGTPQSILKKALQQLLKANKGLRTHHT